MRQAKQRIFGGDTHVAEKLVSKPTEFGKMVKIQESENQIITDYVVYKSAPATPSW